MANSPQGHKGGKAWATAPGSEKAVLRSLATAGRAIGGEARSFAPSKRVRATNPGLLAASLRWAGTACVEPGLRGAFRALAEDVERGEPVALHLGRLAHALRFTIHGLAIAQLHEDAELLERKI